MKYIIIDDNTKYAERLLVELKEEGEVISSEGYVLNELANEINVKAKNDTDTVLLININLKAKNSNRQEQKGIELLIWLRIKDVLNHVVLYSFETLHSLLNRNPKHLIATSQGTTFVQLPSDLGNINLENLSKISASEINLQKTLKEYFDIYEFKHREANWWGLKQLYDVYNSLEQTKLPYPNNIEERLSHINNAVARFVYGQKITINDIETAERSRIREIIDSVQNQIERSKNTIGKKRENIEEAEHEINRLQEYLIGIEETLKSINDFGVKQFKEKVLCDIKEYEELINDEKKEIQLTETELSNKENELNEYADERLNVLNSIKNKYKDILSDYDEIKNKITQRTPRVLYIDDNAGNGWTEMLSNMFTGATIKGVIPEKIYENKIDVLYEKQVKNELTDNISLILLDLRLFDESGRSADIKHMSGKILLEKIRGNYKGVPILMTTASDKVWSYEELLKSGADAYWIKEGISNNLDASDSVRNYFKLVWLVERMTGEKYRFLMKLSNLISHVAIEDNQWWNKDKKNRWRTNDVIDGNTDEILAILKASYDLTKSYLHSFVLEYGFLNQDNEVFYLSSIINKLGNIVEVVHNITNYDYKYLDVADLILKRQGRIGIDLRTVRNTASHRFYDTVNWDEFLLFFEKVQTYLISSNCLPTSDEIVPTEIVKQKFSKKPKLAYPADNFVKDQILGKEFKGLIKRHILNSERKIAGLRIELYPEYYGSLVLNNENYSEYKLGDMINVKVTSITQEGQIILTKV